MTAFLHYELLCDAPNCEEHFNIGERRADATRSQAAQHGWAHGVVPPDPRRGGLSKSVDYCPAHASMIGDLQPKTLPIHARPA
jgi:hypothetical protein